MEKTHQSKTALVLGFSGIISSRSKKKGNLFLLQDFISSSFSHIFFLYFFSPFFKFFFFCDCFPSSQSSFDFFPFFHVYLGFPSNLIYGLFLSFYSFVFSLFPAFSTILFLVLTFSPYFQIPCSILYFSFLIFFLSFFRSRSFCYFITLSRTNTLILPIYYHLPLPPVITN